MKFALISILAMIFMTTSCIKEEDCMSIDKTITLNFGETKSICDDLEINFTSLVSESRCPENAQCAWAGEVEVELTVIEELDQASVLTLKLAGLEGENEVVELRNVKYTLIEATPYPTLDNPNMDEKDYTLMIKIQSP